MVKNKEIVIKITLSGPQGSGKTLLKECICRAFIRYRKQGILPATKINFEEIQTDV